MEKQKFPELPAHVETIMDQISLLEDVTPALAQDIIHTVAWKLIDKIGHPQDHAIVLGFARKNGDKAACTITIHGPSSLAEKTAQRILDRAMEDQEPDGFSQFLDALANAVRSAEKPEKINYRPGSWKVRVMVRGDALGKDPNRDVINPWGQPGTWAQKTKNGTGNI